MTELSLPRRIIINEDASDALNSVIEYYGLKRLLLISDKVISGKDFFRKLVSSLKGRDLEVVEIDEVRPEPSIDEISVAYTKYKDTYDAVVAVGGGSVIDFAKSLSILLKKGSDFDLRGVSPLQPLNIEYVKPLLIAIPTTCGTGSDASYGIVLTDHSEGAAVKLALGNYELVPHITILDPNLLVELPMRLKVGTALDALSHAVEGLVAIDSNEFTKPYSEYVIRTIFKYLPKVIVEPGDIESLGKLLYASTMAGIAFTNAGLGLAHAIAHQLGAGLHIHHGTIVGITLPYVVKFNYRDTRAKALYEDVRRQIKILDGIELGGSFYDDLIKLYDRIGFPSSLSRLGTNYIIDRNEVERYAELTLHDPEIVYNPVPPQYEDIVNIISALVHGDMELIQ